MARLEGGVQATQDSGSVRKIEGKQTQAEETKPLSLLTVKKESQENLRKPEAEISLEKQSLEELYTTFSSRDKGSKTAEEKYFQTSPVLKELEERIGKHLNESGGITTLTQSIDDVSKSLDRIKNEPDLAEGTEKGSASEQTARDKKARSDLKEKLRAMSKDDISSAMFGSRGTDLSKEMLSALSPEDRTKATRAYETLQVLRLNEELHFTHALTANEFAVQSKDRVAKQDALQHLQIIEQLEPERYQFDYGFQGFKLQAMRNQLIQNDKYQATSLAYSVDALTKLGSAKDKSDATLGLARAGWFNKEVRDEEIKAATTSSTEKAYRALGDAAGLTTAVVSNSLLQNALKSLPVPPAAKLAGTMLLSLAAGTYVDSKISGDSFLDSGERTAKYGALVLGATLVYKNMATRVFAEPASLMSLSNLASFSAIGISVPKLMDAYKFNSQTKTIDNARKEADRLIEAELDRQKRERAKN